MKYILAIALVATLSTSLLGQSTGDTIVVQSLHHGSATRDTMVEFPNDPSLTFSRILLKYNMRCTDGKVSTSQNRNRGCGEWDYSCNTYIHDSSKVDSLFSRQISHIISDFSGNTFNYLTNPTYNYYLTYQPNVNVDSVISENQSTVGTGSQILNHTIPTIEMAGKSHYVFTSSELSAAGVTIGNIDGIMINVVNTGGNANFLRVRMKASTDSTLSDIDPDMSAFNEVYFHNTSLVNGTNRLQFHSPFNWNGSDHIIVEFSFTNNNAAGGIQVAGHSTSLNQALTTMGDQYFYMNGSNYIETNSYKGISGNDPRTVEAWIKTTQGGKEIVSWGRDISGGKWNLRLENSGELRVEVNGGNKVGLTPVNDGQWHHIACTYSGNNVTDVNLYVDGVLDGTKGQASKAINTETSNGINLRISRGTNNRYFTGIIDDVRIWSSALSATEINEWKHRKVNSSHPSHSSLEAWYIMNEGSGSAIADSSGNGRHATIVVGNQWNKIYGLDHFKEVSLRQERPNLTFLQGNYVLTSTTDTILDTVLNHQHSVTAYSIHTKSGLQSDSISSAVSYYWQAGYEYVIDTNGQKIDSIQTASTGSITPSYLEYYRRYPMRFEIMSFVTPYGIGLDMGMEGKTWTFDLTDFAPILKGKKRLTMEWGGQWQEEMDIQFEFIVGTPARDVLDIEQIWRVTKPSFNNINTNLDFRPRNVSLLSSGKSFKIRSAITGHGQEGEFIARDHVIDVNNGSLREVWEVWKECGANPVHPQGGTWIYDRAGWCPGMATDLKEIDITSSVNAGSTARLEYDITHATGASNYIVNNQLVTYGNPNFSLDASIVDIKSPTSAVEYAKTNYTCANPTIVIKNTGSATLTKVTIEYWINASSTRESYEWTGSLDFNEEEEVILPSGGTDLWKSMKSSNNHFYAALADPNGGSDEYMYNNSMRSHFEIPSVLPGKFVIWFKTNNAANENKLYVYDSYGNKVFEKTQLQNNTEYRDTLDLGIGCYRLILEDSDDDGIDFWANNDGSGFLRITTTDAPFGTILETLEPDFGRFVELNFTTDHPLSAEDVYILKNEVFNIYPNPAFEHFTVELNNVDRKSVTIFNASGQQIDLSPEISGNKLLYQTSGLTKGIYLVQVNYQGQISSKKVIVQ